MIVIEKKIKCNIGKLFNILNDINKYPYFFEGCSSGKKQIYQNPPMMEL